MWTSRTRRRWRGLLLGRSRGVLMRLRVGCRLGNRLRKTRRDEMTLEGRMGHGITRDAMDRKDWMPTHTRTHARTFGWQGTSGHQAAIARLCLLTASKLQRVQNGAALLCITYPDISRGVLLLLRAGCILRVSLRVETADGKDGAVTAFPFHFSH